VPLRIPHLRRWFAASAIALILVVAGSYFYSRHGIQNALKQVPEKIGLEIQRSAKGFTVSKSLQGHSLFKIEASNAVQFKQGGREELHDVEITVYGRDSGRFDRISGKDFEYDAVSGDVIGKGEVQIDLESNAGALGKPDQSAPTDSRNPIHLKTTDLVFNQKTGDAHSDGKVEFEVAHVQGSAVGLAYAAASNVLTLKSHIQVSFAGFTPISLNADQAAISKTPRRLLLERPHVVEGAERSEADRATVFLSTDNKLERVLAQGNVLVRSARVQSLEIRAEQLDLLMAGEPAILARAVLSGDVRFATSDANGIQGKAGRAILDYQHSKTLKAVYADQGVTVTQHPGSSGKLAPAKSGSTKSGSFKSTASQDFEISSPAMNFFLADGRLIQRAETSGPPQITISPASGDAAGGTTVVTAGKFEANFDKNGQLATVQGGPDSRIVSKSQGKADRTSTSQTIDGEFQNGAIAALIQKGDFKYTDGGITAWADSARYTPQDQILLLEGSPRIADGGMVTTAKTFRLNRLTGTAFAEGDVKTTDNSPQKQAGAGMLSSARPVHVTAENMTATGNPAVAIYKGNVRLWQDATSVEAPSIEFHRDRRYVLAQGSPNQRASTTLTQADKAGRVTPMAISADRLTYSDDARKVHFEGKVVAISKDITATAAQMDCFLQARGTASDSPKPATAGTLDKIVASGEVVVTQNGRRASGDQLVYTAADDKFVMTGGTPSIFDAEHGLITGVSLTLYGHDGRVLVEGSKQSPAVTETRVAR
jgi:lipopolysaccharide export system protein LptA